MSPAPLGAPPLDDEAEAERAQTASARQSLGAERFVRAALAVALILPWWLPVFAQTIPTFYKEWIFVVSFAFAGLLVAPVSLQKRQWMRTQPLILAAAACVGVLVVESVASDGIWRRAALMAFAAAFFAFAVAVGRRLVEQRGESLTWIAENLAIAAIGCCAIAAAQLLLPGLPLVMPLVGGRLSANLGQANHLADLLWLGGLSTALLYARCRLSALAAIVVGATMLIFAAATGSRMAWVYAGTLGLIGLAWRWRHPQLEVRRFAEALIALVLGYALITTALSASGALDAIGLQSAERRAAGAAISESTSQRLWFWRVGLGAAVDHPLLGVGAGRFPGEGVALAMQVRDIPPSAADAQAHNVLVQLAAECGIPLALFVAGCFIVWLTKAWRSASGRSSSAAALVMSIPILIHANLEHPLGYMYFLGVLGLLVGQAELGRVDSEGLGRSRAAPDLLRFASFAVLAAAALGYVQYAQVEKVVRAASDQIRSGAPAQPSRELNVRLAAIPQWSVFGDYAELVSLISAVPTASNAGDLAKRCERAIAIGPSPQLLARCATVLEVAGQSARASYFANSLCKLYPATAAPLLIQAMTFVEQNSAAGAEVVSTCVQRVR